MNRAECGRVIATFPNLSPSRSNIGAHLIRELDPD